MQTDLYPLTFHPIYRDYLWGGSRIAQRFGRTDAPARCAEAWEVAAHPDGNSVVEEGPLAGRDLADLCRSFGAALCGSLNESDRFPLLIKLIDAKERLSVQVHPDDENAARYGGEAKTEMWYILDADPDSVLYAGLQPNVGPRIFHDALVDKQVPPLLRSVPATPGRALYMPGGTVHAIGEGCLILEVQQNSNTTYRVYDWDRVGADGKPRELHVLKAMEVIDWRAPSLGLLAPVPDKRPAGANPRSRIVRSDFFRMDALRLESPETVALDGTTFQALFVAEGSVRVEWGEGRAIRLACGRSCLVPAALPAYALTPEGDTPAKVLITSL